MPAEQEGKYEGKQNDDINNSNDNSDSSGVPETTVYAAVKKRTDTAC